MITYISKVPNQHWLQFTLKLNNYLNLTLNHKISNKHNTYSISSN